MIRSGLNENEVEALRRLRGEHIVQSADYQPSSRLYSSTASEAISSVPIPDTPQSGLIVKVLKFFYSYVRYQLMFSFHIYLLHKLL